MGLIARGLNLTLPRKHSNGSVCAEDHEVSFKSARTIVSKLRENMAFYEKDPLYQQLRELVFRSFGHYALEVREEEAMLHFVFLLSFSVFSEQDFRQYMLQRSRFTPTALTDTLILEHILHLYRPAVPQEIEANCYFHLSQIHSRLYFFKEMSKFLIEKIFGN